MMAVLTADIEVTKRRRLAQLERQAAALGYDTPPQIANEIADIQRELRDEAPATVAESHTILYDFMMQINTRIDRLYWWMLLLAVVIILAVKL
jgi:hypothetical protein